MQNAYSADQVRNAEIPLLEAGEPLMARASFGLHNHVSRVVQSSVEARTGTRGHAGAHVVFLVGPGNNGGDTLFAAARMARLPARVTVVLAGANVHVEGLDAVRSTQAKVLHLVEGKISDDLVELINHADVVVDGLLGIGARGAPRGVIGELLRRLNLAQPGRSGSPVVVAVDVPSGVDATSGAVDDPECVIAADVTVTFGAKKTGLLVAPGAVYAGSVEVVDIGLTFETVEPMVQQLEAHDFADGGVLNFLVGEPNAFAHKYTRGVVGIVAGSAAFPGAGLLATAAANHCGIGMVRFCGDSEVAKLVVNAMPEVVPAQGRVQAWLVGSGMEATQNTHLKVLEVLERGLPAVFDAGALAVLESSDLKLLGAQHVLTPHAGELADLLNRLVGNFTRETVEADPLGAAQKLHLLTSATVVAKGPHTIVVGQGGTFADKGGTSRLATAGSGDVLAGVIAAKIALATAHQSCQQETNTALIAAAGVMIHTNAGNVASRSAEVLREGTLPTAPHPITASNIVTALPLTHAMLAGQNILKRNRREL